MKATRSVALLGLLAAAWLAPACKRRKPETPVDAAVPDEPTTVPALGPVEVRNMGGPLPGRVHIDDAALSERARTRLSEAGIFAPTPPGPDGSAPRATARTPLALVLAGYQIEDVRVEPRGAVRAVVQLRIGVRPTGVTAFAWNEEVEAGGEIPYELGPGKTAPDLQGMFSALLERMLDDLLSAYTGRLALRGASDAAVLKALSSPVLDVREEAVRQVGRRRLRAGVDPLLTLLDHDDERLRDAALGALLAMRERRAIDRLGQSRSMRDPREMGKALEAIAQLGGPDAESYLRFVIDAQEDGEIKDMARAALERLRRRQADKPAP